VDDLDLAGGNQLVKRAPTDAKDVRRFTHVQQQPLNSRVRINTHDYE
jgi:hypothetical protein